MKKVITATQDAQSKICHHLKHLAEEQVLFLKNSYKMMPEEIISLYGGQTNGSETYIDAVERIATFNLISAGQNGFVAEL